ncbi:nitrilase-related carbon-nitrogen hydrolase [Antarcticimicrobium sediminis]|uniref:Nitrilase n=1 Tax=Antarcticimicrobium sediminis TaxID=2546227 RepID=A0A4R5EIT9_9RHOB|nr:nitrilase-related carbon-nitrogen hydrolase [Antarcticimicrobium sediminis]TDE34348.1 nitrilase [Antarcticimicrobium sediminis]
MSETGSETDTGLTLALWQAPSVAGNSELAFDEIGKATAAAGRAGADIVVFPELFVTGYERDDFTELALSQEALCARLAPIARAAGCAICVGYPERVGEQIANAALYVSAGGKILGNHHKIQLFGEVEAQRFIAGDRYTVFEFAGRKLAILICYDVEFAPHIAALKQQGVDLVLVPTAAMDPFGHVGAHVVPAMAANHGLTILYANLCGQEAHLTYFGGSVIAGADGQILAQAGRGPCLLLSQLPLEYDHAVLSTQDRDFRPISDGM